MVKYTREQRLRAVRLYERYGRSAAAVIDELGYPSGQTLAVWHRLWVRAGRDGGESLGDRRGERYTPEQKRVAVAHYLAHGRCLRRTMRALGYPSHELLAGWVEQLAPGRRRRSHAPVDADTRRRAVMEYASGAATSAQVARGLGVSPTAVRNWKRSMLAGDKERTMAHRTKTKGRTKSKAGAAAAVDADVASLRREREGLAAELAGMRAERDRLAVELEMMRYSKELVGKEPGADPDNLTNSEKTRVVVHLAAVFGLRHSDLLERVGIARSTFYHNLKQLDRPGRDE
ncbi:transposase [Bifidobacterium pseudolongum]|uniref:transposase n=1 Tax=Bifidobacterium pseudolongum TaxID=1694 RepID=UPI0022E7436F|nr:transposase [Bifidobacterium pseudolongum]